MATAHVGILASTPPHVWIVVGALVVVTGSAASAYTDNLRVERRIYWLSWLFGAILMSVAVANRGWKLSAITLTAIAVVAVIVAYFRTSYVKIGGRVFAYTITRSQPDPAPDGSPHSPADPPPDSYGGLVTAATHWWTLSVLSVGAGGVGLSEGMTPVTIAAIALAATALALTGYLDARDGFDIGRKQRGQLLIIVIASIPVFLVPALAYAIGYYIDRPARGS
ncbi:hypothetical protein [Mycolicibacterium canariasense]|uniref:hypothetical protein n=1 Tax=Mycolicibacterium canariasense TaxID=228230 RepID=UPI001A98B90E|nr:hypothetical protein [Mycolicibacterium canariasense]MCV7209690.1 hypothetical protein [Mycolicibacterium canariasense]